LLRIAAPLVWRSDGGTLMRDIVISDTTILDGGVLTCAGDVATGGERIVAAGGAGR
jgi:hypothetical protein